MSTPSHPPLNPTGGTKQHSALAFKLLLQPNPDRYVLYPILDHKLWQMVKQSYASVWFPEEIDLADWEQLTNQECHFLSHILAFFAGADGIINENLLANFSQEVQCPEARCFYRFQIFIENVHAETYTLLLDMYVKDLMEKAHLFHGISTISSIKDKADWVLKWCNTTHATFAEQLIAFAAVEGIHFLGAFCAIFWLKQCGLLPGLCFTNTLISHDEGLHHDFACLLHKRLIMLTSPTCIRLIIEEAINIEINFICDALPIALLGMNAKLMAQYIKYVAYHLLTELSQPHFYHVKNPFPWMEQILLQNKANFFEHHVAEYAKSGIGMMKINITVLKRPRQCKVAHFPVVINHVTTGHKLQGKLMDELVVAEWSTVQNWAYVVLSRVQMIEGLYLIDKIPSDINFTPPKLYTKMMDHLRSSILADPNEMEVFQSQITIPT